MVKRTREVSPSPPPRTSLPSIAAPILLAAPPPPKSDSLFTILDTKATTPAELAAKKTGLLRALEVGTFVWQFPRWLDIVGISDALVSRGVTVTVDAEGERERERERRSKEGQSSSEQPEGTADSVTPTVAAYCGTAAPPGPKIDEQGQVHDEPSAREGVNIRDWMDEVANGTFVGRLDVTDDARLVFYSAGSGARYHVTPAPPTTLAEEVVAIDDVSKKVHHVGSVDGKLIVSPDVAYILAHAKDVKR